MTSPKWTPGPWTVFDEDDRCPGIDSPELSIILYDDVDGGAGVQGRTHEEALANARLIAAAPELLDGLLSALAECRALWRRANYTPGEIAAMSADWVAATEKATGVKP